MISFDLPMGKRDHITWDVTIPGFGLRLRGQSDGAVSSATFVFQYRVGLKQRRMVLGRAGALTVDEAREIARRFYLDVKLRARDPSGERLAISHRRSELHRAENEIMATMNTISDLRRRIHENHN